MITPHSGQTSNRDPVDHFTTTQWSLVIAAGQGQTKESRQALASLCEKYWYPLYAFVRRSGHDAEDARDFVQGFFAVLLEKDYLKEARRERGRFRSFLLVSLKHFMANEQRRARAQKRGGGRVPLSLDFETAERRYRLEPTDPLTPEIVFEQRWALTLFEQALEALREEHTAEGKAFLFDRLKAYLTFGEPRVPYHQLAVELEKSEGAVKVAIHRLRKRFGDLLRSEIAQTLLEPDEVEDEVQHLFALFS